MTVLIFWGLDSVLSCLENPQDPKTTKEQNRMNSRVFMPAIN
ncbi:hypothetical protein C943_00882 [Mariniradius saccharolyticus AK6]|uniref:Uncharacterized protein n=1 Tax=Mariniradius saccharolyticus AK6 TaxID=1239962 RepID=M7Y6N2_9BACT|nr:hypothetical protein C943_00882 [Mariniradius saccharolyticus AK6]